MGAVDFERSIYRSRPFDPFAASPAVVIRRVIFARYTEIGGSGPTKGRESMKEMLDQEAAEGVRLVRQRFHGGSERTVLVRDEEIRVPSDRLIVSRTDRRGLITDVNDAFCEISGYRREQVLGEPHCILRHPDMPRAAFRSLWETVEGGRLWNGYVKNLAADGRFYWVYATIIPVRRKGEIVGFTSVRREPSRAAVIQAEEIYRTLE